MFVCCFSDMAEVCTFRRKNELQDKQTDKKSYNQVEGKVNSPNRCAGVFSPIHGVIGGNLSPWSDGSHHSQGQRLFWENGVASLAPPPLRNSRCRRRGGDIRLTTFGLCASRCGPARAAPCRTRARFFQWSFYSLFSNKTQMSFGSALPGGRPPRKL